MNSLKLYQFQPAVKLAILAFLILQLSGVLFGLVHLYMSTQLTTTGTTLHYRGEPIPEDDLEIQEHFEKPLSELLLTTHNHLLGFSFIFAILVTLFYKSSIVNNTLKNILMVEPFGSVLLTFLSIWGLRFISPHFAIAAILFGVITYASYFLMAGLMIFELAFKQDEALNSSSESDPK